MSASIAFGSPVEELVGDELVKFSRLNMRESSTLAETIRSNNVAAARAAATEQGDRMSAADRAGFVFQASKEPVTDSDIWVYLGTRPGIDSVLKKALTKQGKSDGEAVGIIDQMDLLSSAELARILVGLITTKPSPKVGKPEERDWVSERLLIQLHCPNLGQPDELTREQYEVALFVAKERQKANKAE